MQPVVAIEGVCGQVEVDELDQVHVLVRVTCTACGVVGAPMRASAAAAARREHEASCPARDA